MLLLQQEGKLKSAQKGHESLKKKSEALKKVFRQVTIKIFETNKRIGAHFTQAMLSLAGANFAAGDFQGAVTDQVKSKSSARLTVSGDNIAGVHLPKFSLRSKVSKEENDKVMLGLTAEEKLNSCRDNFSEYLKVLVSIASLQTQFVALDEIIKIVNRRVNALEYVVIPKIEKTISFIEKELEEQEREDLFRRKRISDNKKKLKQTQAEQKLPESSQPDCEGDTTDHTNMLEESDDDVVF
ncbi:unnamed protein product [Moneuplotes crassus]|uniref:V-type proton ATPase subunit D n=1 Tax=Euplotes crassus TaxID=5936 RepID=A0AAD1XUC0_EUPCR|nr:unnamed protein product [Moneuplotes crassus]